MVRWILVGALAATGGASEARAERLSVAAAASLRPAMEEWARAFEAKSGTKVHLTFGASGAFVAQIEQGAPFDVFFSADRDYPRKLVEAKLAEEEVVYALGALALWSRGGSKRGDVGALAGEDVRRVAIANPAIAPYGRAALEALRAAGVEDEVRPKLVFGQSVAQAAQFAESGAVDAAILPVAIARLPALAKRGGYVVLPRPRVEHSAVVLRASERVALARAFLAFVRGGEGRAILAKHGYQAPESFGDGGARGVP